MNDVCLAFNEAETINPEKALVKHLSSLCVPSTGVCVCVSIFRKGSAGIEDTDETEPV